MSKMDDAKKILIELGLPISQQNDMSALTLLALCNISETDNWRDAKKVSLGVSKGIMKFISEVYKKEYAPNTRETVRRFVLHQFIQARIADYNPDIPNLPVNSPRAHYAISDEALEVIRTYGTTDWLKKTIDFKKRIGDLKKIYEKSREVDRVPVNLPNGKVLHLSPGKHNEVQAAILEQFRPEFANDSILLYLGDTEQKNLYINKDKLKKLRIPINKHSKLPDIVLYDENRKWIFLVEAVTSHGPMSPKRVIEINEILKFCSAGKIFVSAFQDFREFKKWSHKIAWETEIWISEMPNHLIHFNGDRFIGPR